MSVYAIVKAGGRQVKVSKGDKIRIDKTSGDVGSNLCLSDVLFVSGDEVRVGTPTLEGVSLDCTILEHGKAKKVLIFKKRRRKNYRRKRGFRAQYTLVEIKDLNGISVNW